MKLKPIMVICFFKRPPDDHIMQKHKALERPWNINYFMVHFWSFIARLSIISFLLRVHDSTIEPNEPLNFQPMQMNHVLIWNSYKMSQPIIRVIKMPKKMISKARATLNSWACFDTKGSVWISCSMENLARHFFSQCTSKQHFVTIIHRFLTVKDFPSLYSG